MFAKMAFRIVKVMEEEVPALKSPHKINFQVCNISKTMKFDVCVPRSFFNATYPSLTLLMRRD